MLKRHFPSTPQLKAFQDADDAWDGELRRVFGKQSALARYTNLGKGEEGTAVRKLFEARDAARTAWLSSAYTNRLQQ